MHWFRDARPRGRFLGNGDEPRVRRVHRFVEFLEKRDGLQILATAVPVLQPLPLFAAVVQVEHRCHRVDAQPVAMKLVQPVERVGGEEIANLIPPVVEDQRAPIRVFAQARIFVLIQGRSVESTKREVVFWKVRRNPVENHADVVLVQRVDEEAEIVWRAVARRRRVVAAHLVAPRSVERVLHDRQQLHVREPKALHMLGEARRDLAIREHAIAVFRDARPRSEMRFVDRTAAR